MNIYTGSPKTVRQQAERIHGLEGEVRGLIAGAEEVRKELREARELIIAFITQMGSVEVHDDGRTTFSFFLYDAQIARVSRDDVFSFTYDNKEGGKVYMVDR